MLEEKYYKECLSQEVFIIWEEFFTHKCSGAFDSIKEEFPEYEDRILNNDSVGGIYATLLYFGDLESIRINPVSNDTHFLIEVVKMKDKDKIIHQYTSFNDLNIDEFRMEKVSVADLKKMILYLVHEEND